MNVLINFDRTVGALGAWAAPTNQDSWTVLRGLATDLWAPDGRFADRDLGRAPFRDAWASESKNLGQLSEMQGMEQTPPRLYLWDRWLMSPFALVWIDIRRAKGRITLPESTLIHARRSWIASRGTGDNSGVTDEGRADTVLLFTVHGPDYSVPDLIFVGPGEPSATTPEPENGGERVFKLELSRLQPSSDADLRSTLAQLQQLADPTRWRGLFTNTDGSALRERIRLELKKRLSKCMELLEKQRGVDASDGELKILREAATLIAFRLMFLGEVERRGLLYAEKPDLQFVELCAMASDPSAEVGRVVDRFRNLCAAMRGEASDVHVRLRGASIFASQPSPEFDGRLTDWLEPFDRAGSSIDPGGLKDWDLLLAGLANVVLGFLDDHQSKVADVHLAENRAVGGVLGVGGAEHAHRLLGEVYEQVLALHPVRRDGKPQLVLDKSTKAAPDTKKAQNTERTKLGAHYTPEMLVREMVRPALGILFEERWCETGGDLKKYFEAIKNLRVVDPAMGSGHFLTVAALELARELAIAEIVGAPDSEHFSRFAGVEHQDRHSEVRVTPELRPKYQAALARWIPEVVRRSCYGVDVSPLACELGKLSLWLFTLTVQQDVKPELTFLDGNIRCGNSLVGSGWTFAKRTFKARMKGLDLAGSNVGLGLFDVREAGHGIQAQRQDIEQIQAALALPTPELRAWCADAGARLLLTSSLPADNYELRKLVREAVRDRMRPLRWVYDLAVLLEWYDVKNGKADALCKAIHDLTELPGPPLPLSALFDKPLETQDEAVAKYRAKVPEVLKSANREFSDEPLLPLHWSYEFPAVFAGERPGFDAILANPPFIGDRDLRGRLGQDLVEYMVSRFTAPRNGGTCDLSGFFVLLYDDILARTRAVAVTLAPNTLAQAKNRKTVLVPLVNGTVGGEGPHFRIARATQSQVWPGEAAVHVCVVWFTRRDTQRQQYVRMLDGEDSWTVLPVDRISTFLDSYRDAPIGYADAFDLPSASEGLFLTGMFLRGADGRPGDFVKEKAESQAFVEEATRRGERKAVYAYLNNKLVQSQPKPQADGVCVDFYDVLLDAGLLDEPAATQLAWLRKHYEFCLGAIDDVRKERQKLASSGSNRVHKEYWWLFGNARPELRRKCRGRESVFAVGRVGKIWVPFFLPRLDPEFALPFCPMDKIYSAPDATPAVVGTSLSALFEQHVRRTGSTLKSDLNFSPDASLTSFPFPWPPHWSADLGAPATLPASPITDAKFSTGVDALLSIRRGLLEDAAVNLPGIRLPKGWGPTELYNLYDSEKCSAPGIEELRTAHRNLLDVVLREYGWTALADAMAADDGGGWAFENPWIDRTQRYVPKLTYREQMLERLMERNEQRYWEEIDLYMPHVVALAPTTSSKKLTPEVCNAGGIKIDDVDLKNVLDVAVKRKLLIADGTGYRRP